MDKDAHIFQICPYWPYLAFIFESTCRDQVYLTFDRFHILTIDAKEMYIQYLKVWPQIQISPAFVVYNLFALIEDWKAY